MKIFYKKIIYTRYSYIKETKYAFENLFSVKKAPMTALDENVNRVPRVYTNERETESEFFSS